MTRREVPGGAELRFASAMRAALRMIVFIMLTLAYAVTVLLLSLSRLADARRVSLIARHWAASMIDVMGLRLEVEGVPPDMSVLIVANHRSYIDVVAIMSQVPCVMLAKSELAGWPLIGMAARAANTVFVDRNDRGSRKSARQSLAGVLDSGISAVVFPEGTTSAGPGILPFRPGIFHMADAGGIQIVPAAIEYADSRDCWVGDDTFFRHFMDCFRKKEISLRICFGHRLSGADAATLKSEAEKWITGNLRKNS